jgi:DNA-binding NarL/FixJ family response regulator
MNKKIPKDQPVHVLSIGTRILVKDVMDQYLRTLGEVKTYYASKLSVAVENFREKRHAVIFCEQSFPEGSALEFIELIGGLDNASDRYFVLATEAHSDELAALAMEKGIDEILVKPFATDHIMQIMERYLEKRANQSSPWINDLRAAKKAYIEKRFQEAEELHGLAAKNHWHNSAVLLDCADFFIMRSQPQKAVPLLEKILGESPDNVRALHLSGLAMKKLGRLQEAAKQLQRASQFSPLNSVRNIELADVYVAMAEEQVLQAQKTESESSALILRKSQYMLLRKDYAALVTYLDAKKPYLSDLGKKEADAYVSLAKKLAGLK